MGEAKRRGSFETRKNEGIERERQICLEKEKKRQERIRKEQEEFNALPEEEQVRRKRVRTRVTTMLAVALGAMATRVIP